MSIKKRLQKMENQIPDKRAPRFHAWLGDEWAEAEKADALRDSPGCTFFWKLLSRCMPCEDRVNAEQTGKPPNKRRTPYIAGT